MLEAKALYRLVTTRRVGVLLKGEVLDSSNVKRINNLPVKVFSPTVRGNSMTKKKAKKKPTATPEPDSPQDASGSFQPDLRLPPRLFATDRFPTKRLNIYSSPEILPFLRHVLRDTKEFQIIRESCFGKLFDIPARQCPVSAKLIHSFLTRQLVCLPKNTLWSVFGGNPLRYGLQEFGTVTGLNCASFPEGYHPDTAKPVVAGKDEVWKRLFGKKTMVTIAELCLMLEEDKKMEHWKKIRIALIIIVDGVLIAHKQQARATPRYVKMLKNLKTFFAFPWGRESFVKTISCMKPPKPSLKNGNDPVSWLLKQDSFRLQSFPLTLQLVAFRAIPQLLSFIPAEPDQRTLMDLEDGYLPQHKSIDSIGVRRVEFSSDLAVSPIIPIESQPQSGWGEWPNDPKDDCVIYMEQLIADQFTFNKGMWPAGVTTEPLLIKPKARGHRKGMFPTRVKQSLKPKKVIKKETSSRKQRRISSYFTRSSVASFTNEQLSEMVLKLQKQMKQLHKLLQKKKKTSHPMQRSFHTLISRSKKPATSHKARHEAPIHQDVPDTSHHQHQPVQAPPLDDDHPTDQKVAMCEHTQFRGLKPFMWKRIPDLYTNTRSGDCGPVSMKFLEMHAHGDPPPQMSSITDRIVDNIRKQYAMDIYKTIVLPSYYAARFTDA
ncbi:LOW QUALITY PROTEIN: hypothetical protein BRARA_B03377 [Brassica rapa]|uniref:DUF1985 domain-containing protein n=1 Tax=Brassica campestris TaxID=3711 RepID=A0A398AI74_BRACM|nr:LOW QUALITY PROTEIN: hypothetical protein BRARA_B03377 [Brassica rapa]